MLGGENEDTQTKSGVSCDINVGKIVLELPPTERQKEGDVLDSNRLTAKLY